MEYNLKYEEYCIQNEDKEIVSAEGYKSYLKLIDIGMSKEQATKKINNLEKKGLIKKWMSN